MVQNEVPDKTIIRHLTQDNGKLLSEIDRLNHIIEQKDLAIKEFKKWQSKVAERKYAYWFNEGIKLMETPPDEELHTKLKKVFTTDALLKKRAKGCLVVFEQHERAKMGLKTALESKQV